MYALAEKKWKRPIDWKQLVPRCAHAECRAGSNWSALLRRASGFWFNDQSWFCSSRCLEESLEDHLLGYFFKDRNPAPRRTTMPMGLMMFDRGIISAEQLRAAIDLQRLSGERIGACLQRLAPVSEDDIASVVATQWGCPVFPAESVQPGCSLLVPCSLLERYRMLPVHLVGQGQRLFVGFCDQVNHTALLVIEQMLGCETEACIIAEAKLLQGIEARKQLSGGEAAVHRPGSAAESARMILSYAQQTAAGAIRLRAVEGNIWVRFLAARSHMDLVFVAAAL